MYWYAVYIPANVLISLGLFVSQNQFHTSCLVFNKSVGMFCVTGLTTKTMFPKGKTASLSTQRNKQLGFFSHTLNIFVQINQ